MRQREVTGVRDRDWLLLRKMHDKTMFWVLKNEGAYLNTPSKRLGPIVFISSNVPGHRVTEGKKYIGSSG